MIEVLKERQLTKPLRGEMRLNWRGWLGLSAVLALAGALRFYDLDVPNFMVFDEDYYVRDACAYVAEAEFFCGSEEFTIWHPPMGKWLIAAGIWMFTPTAFGARVMAALAGTLSIAVLFLLARRVLRSTLGAVIASGLLAFDFLHVVVSRTAILDGSSTFFVLLALLFVVKDLDARAEPGREQIEPDPVRGWMSRDVTWSRLRWCWRPLGGVAIGLAIATKWTVAPMLLVLIALILGDARRRAKASGTGRPLAWAIRSETGSLVTSLIFIPALVYSATFVGRIEGSFLAVPWSEASWFRALGERQVDMLQYHLDLRRHLTGSREPFHSSPAWSWPLIQRPIPVAFAVRDGQYREILALGNPLVWWPALICVGMLFLGAMRKGRDGLSSWVIVGGLAGTYLFWLLFPSLNNVFIYYFVAAVPFLCLAVAAIVVQLAAENRGRAAIGAYLAAVLVSFAFFYPVLTFRPLAPDEWRRRVPFSQCKPFDIGNKEVAAGYPFPLDAFFGGPVESYPDGQPDEEFVPLLTTRDGWCWR